MRVLTVRTITGKSVTPRMALHPNTRPFLEGALAQAGLSREEIARYFKELERE